MCNEVRPVEYLVVRRSPSMSYGTYYVSNPYTLYQEALDKAKSLCEENGISYHVVEILDDVEEAAQPVKVTPRVCGGFL